MVIVNGTVEGEIGNVIRPFMAEESRAVVTLYHPLRISEQRLSIAGNDNIAYGDWASS